MGKALVTILPDKVVSAEYPVYFDCVTVKMHGNCHIQIKNPQNNITLKIVGDGYFCDDANYESLGVKEYVHDSLSLNVYMTGSDYYLIVPRKEELTRIYPGPSITGKMELNLKSATFLKNMPTFDGISWATEHAEAYGDVTNLIGYKSATIISFWGLNGKVTGKVERLIAGMYQTGRDSHIEIDGNTYDGGPTFNGHGFNSSYFAWALNVNNSSYLDITRTRDGENPEIITVDFDGNVIK